MASPCPRPRPGLRSSVGPGGTEGSEGCGSGDFGGGVGAAARDGEATGGLPNSSILSSSLSSAIFDSPSAPAHVPVPVPVPEGVEAPVDFRFPNTLLRELALNFPPLGVLGE